MSAIFTKEMKQTHTLLIPNMLPVHFTLIREILQQYGYKAELLRNDSHGVVDEGLRYVHNDMCYPALLVIGQMIDALESGAYDPKKVAFMITQTGGGCRASNYIYLLRKALERSGYADIPVVSLNALGLDDAPGFRLTLGMTAKFIYAVVVGDFLMCIANQCRPYEQTPGDTDRMVDRWTKTVLALWRKRGVVTYRGVKRLYLQILQDFADIPKLPRAAVKVGVVGEIFVKYAPIGNNHLEDFLLAEGAEVVVPGLLDFLMYCVCNGMDDQKLYGDKPIIGLATRVAYNYLKNKQRDAIDAINAHGVFAPPMAFNNTRALAASYISPGVKMGEGWLLTVEMVELIHQGVNNIVCTQPFGCLPNHIVGKGMMNQIKTRHPGANVVAIDYDPGASEVNQQNRIKMMLANANRAAAEKEEPAEANVPVTVS